VVSRESSLLQNTSSRKRLLELRLTHAFAHIRDGAPRKPPELRRRCLRLATLSLCGLELGQPEAQLGAILRRELRDGLLNVFQGHQHRIAAGTRDLLSWPPAHLCINPLNASCHRRSWPRAAQQPARALLAAPPLPSRACRADTAAGVQDPQALHCETTGRPPPRARPPQHLPIAISV
jgi:hypothetical protein